MQALGIFSTFSFSHSNRGIVVFHCVFISIFLMTDKVDIFSCAYFPPVNSFLVKCLFMYFAHILIEFFSVLNVLLKYSGYK